jgi:DNA-binding NarL/FixJ family response regulator
MTAAALGTRPASRDGAELPSGEPVRVVIADNDGLARSMMKTALDDARGIAVIATTGEAREMVELVRYYRPGVLITDTGLVRDRVAKLLGAVRAASPVTRVLTISIADDHAAFEALRSGAVGHLSKDIDPAQLASLSRERPAARPSCRVGWSCHC